MPGRWGSKLAVGAILIVLIFLLLYITISTPPPSEVFQPTQIQVGGQSITKITDEPGWETHFVSTQTTPDSLIIQFYHNSTEPQPVWIECLTAQLSNEDAEIKGCNFSLSTDLAQPGQTVTLTIPLVAGQVPLFRLHVGPDSEVFEFGPLAAYYIEPTNTILINETENCSTLNSSISNASIFYWDGTTAWANANVNLTGNFTLDCGTLIMNESSDDQYWFQINSDGNLSFYTDQAIESNGWDFDIDLNANGTIDWNADLNMTGTGSDNDDYGIVINYDGATIDCNNNKLINDDSNGIFIATDYNHTIRNCIIDTSDTLGGSRGIGYEAIVNPLFENLQFEGVTGIAGRVATTSNLILKNSIFNTSSYGFTSRGLINATVDNSTFNDITRAIRWEREDQENITIKNSNFNDCDYGIDTAWGDNFINLNISNNNFDNCTTNCIYLYGNYSTPTITIENNNFTDSKLLVEFAYMDGLIFTESSYGNNNYANNNGAFKFGGVTNSIVKNWNLNNPGFSSAFELKGGSNITFENITSNGIPYVIYSGLSSFGSNHIIRDSVLTGPGWGYGIGANRGAWNLTVDNVTSTNFTNGYHAERTPNSNNITIINSNFSNNLDDAITMYWATFNNVNITNNDLSNAGDMGIYIYNNQGDATGLYIKNNDFSNSADYAISLTNFVNDAIIEKDNNFDGCWNGMGITGNNFTFRDWNLSMIDNIAFAFGGDNWFIENITANGVDDGIIPAGSTNSRIQNSDFSQSTNCIYPQNNINLTIENITAIGCSYGVRFYATNNDITILNSNFSNSYTGIGYYYHFTLNLTDLNVSNSDFSNARDYGINLRSNVEISNLTISNNNFDNVTNYDSIYLSDVNNSIFNNNSFVGNRYGVFIDSNTIGNIFYNNTFNQSSIAFARVDEPGNHFNTTGSAQGNLWGDILQLRIYDTDYDGYGDAGPDYPYSNATSTNVTGYVTDWGPLTSNANARPNQTAPFLNATSPDNLTTNNLTCWNRSTFDLDGDPVTNYYTWYRDSDVYWDLYELEPESSMILLMHLNNDSSVGENTTLAYDYSGEGNNGTLVSVAWNCTHKKLGDCSITFDGGATDCISNTAPATNLTESIGSGNFTIAMWFYPTDGTTRQIMFMMGEEATDKAVYFDWGDVDNKLQIEWWGGGGSAETTNTISLNEWHHIVGVYDNVNSYIYVDGVQDGSVGYVNSNLGDDVIRIGCYSGGLPFKGKEIDEVAVWNRSLSASEILEMYNKTKDLYSTNTTIPSSHTAKGQTWSCNVTPWDGILYGTSLGSNNLTILNTPPTVNLSYPPNATTGYPLTLALNWTFSDPSDGDNQSAYQIQIDNNSDFSSPEVNVTNSTSASYHTATLGSDVYYWRVRANDTNAGGSDWSNWSETWQFQTNPPPNTTYLEFNSILGTNFTNEDLACWATGEDLIDENLTAYWVIYNGTQIFGSGATNLTNGTLTLITTVGSGNTTKHEIWNCSVRMFDGLLNESDWNNASLTILNNPPNITTLLTEVNISSGYTFVWDYNATDFDVDQGVDALTWYDNTSLFDINSSTGLIQDIPAETEAGPHTIRVNVTDLEAWDEDNFTYTVFNDYWSPNDTFTATYFNATGSILGLLFNGSQSYQAQAIKYNSSTWGPRLEVDGLFNQSDVDATTLKIEASSEKTAINFSGTQGFALAYTLFVPTGGKTEVYVCPNAAALSEVHVDCTNITHFTGPYPQIQDGITVTNVTVDGIEYFKISNLATGAAQAENASLSIWDDTDLGLTKIVGETIYFYADYTRDLTGADITDGTCQIRFEDPPTGPSNMVYTAGTYQFNRTYTMHGAVGDHLWNVTCARPGFETEFANDTVYISPPPLATLVTKLTIPDNTRSVYVPGVGNVSPTTDGSWTAPPRYYLASYKDNILYGLVHSYQIPLSINLSSTATNHTLVLTQTIPNSQAFLVFTRGNWQKIDKRMDLIEGLDFLTKISPTFGFGLGYLYPIKVVLTYTNLDMGSDLILQKGDHRFVVHYNETVNGTPVIVFLRIS